MVLDGRRTCHEQSCLAIQHVCIQFPLFGVVLCLLLRPEFIRDDSPGSSVTTLLTANKLLEAASA